MECASTSLGGEAFLALRGRGLCGALLWSALSALDRPVAPTLARVDLLPGLRLLTSQESGLLGVLGLTVADFELHSS